VYREQKGRVETTGKKEQTGLQRVETKGRKERMEGKSCNKNTDAYGRNEMDQLTRKEEQEEQDRRLERKHGPNGMKAFK